MKTPLIAVVLCLFACTPLATRAEESAKPLPPVVARYEQMLVRTPAKGTAFEKVYQHYFEGEGIEKLAARWQELSEKGGPDEPAYWLLRGLLAERQGQNDLAIAHLTKATELRPKDSRAWSALGDLQAGLGKFPSAIAAFRQALDSGAAADSRPRLFRQLARSQARNFDVNGAVQTWQEFVAESPDDPFVLEEAGEALADAERFPEARALFEKLKARAGVDAYQRVRAVLKIAQLEEQQGRGSAARELYESALPMAAESSWMHREVRTRIEELFRRQDDLPGLTQYYQRWLEGHPRDVEAALRLSDVLIELNKKPDAVTWLRQAAEWAPNRQEVQIALAKRLSETGHPDEAVPILKRLAQERPEEQNLPELLGEAQWLIFEKSKDEKDRAAALESWRKLAPETTKDSSQPSHLGDLLRRHMQADLAIAEYRRAIALAPAVADLRERLIEYFFELERPADAWKEVESLLTMAEPNFVRIARLQLRHRASAWALATVESGLAAQPKNFDLLVLQWDLLTEAKRWPEALALFEAMSDSAPNTYFLDDVEGRYLMALNATNQADDFRKNGLAKLGTGSLTERELRLLARQALTGNDTETSRKVLVEGRTRFPESFALARLEVEQARVAGDLPARVAGLRRLMELQPKRKPDFLRELVSAYREESRWDEGLAAVQELIAASPANPDAQVLAADLLLAAGRFDEAVQKLRAAIKLSDNPNSLRLRLSRMYFEAGQLVKARETLDEAFEAAEKPNDRLALMPQLAEAYFADGKLDLLLERFRQRQRAEDEGWRYALYLAEIYKQTLDFGAARRELARALAARPRDSGLLRQMVKLATDEANQVEITRYQELLTEAEPSDSNQLALLEAYLESSQADAAFAVLQRQLPAVKKTQGAWERLLPKLAQHGLLDRVNALISAQPGGTGALETRLQVAIVQATGGKLDEANRLLWEIYKMPSAPLVVEPLPSELNSSSAPAQMSAFTQRLNDAQQTRQVVERLLDPDRYGGGSSTYYVNGAPTRANVDPVDTARDSALLYLAAIAVKQNKVSAFLEELERQHEARGSNRAERFLAKLITQNKPALWKEIQAQAKDPNAAREFDWVCLGQLLDLVQMNRYSSDKIVIDANEALSIFQTLRDRMPKVKWWGDSDETDAMLYSSLGMKEKMREYRQKRLAALKLDKPEMAFQNINYAFAEGRLDLVHQICEAVAKSARDPKANVALQQNLSYLPLSVLQQSDEVADDAVRVSGEERMSALADILTLWYPAAPPRAGLGSSSSQGYYGRDNNLPATRFFNSQQMSVLAQMAMQFGSFNGYSVQGAAPKNLPILRRYLEAQAKSLPPSQRIYPRLIGVYFDAWSGKYAPAAAAATALLQDYPGDGDLQLLTAALLGKNRQYSEALALLAQIPPRYGQGNVDLQMQLLAYAKLGGDQETAKKAALRLTTLRLSPQERQTVAADLRALGLTEKADLLAKQSNTLSGRTNGASTYDQYRLLRAAVEEKQKDQSLAIARGILNDDPLQLVRNEYIVGQAFSALQTFDQLEPFIAESESALEKSPDSLRLNYILANAWQAVETPRDRSLTGPNVTFPCWLKLERKGTRISGLYSTDGQDWKSVGNLSVKIENDALAGLALVGREPQMETFAEFGHLQLTPSAEGAEWKSADLGRLQKPGKLESKADGVYRLQAGAGWIGFEADAIQFMRQPLSGDGVVSVQFLSADSDKGFGEAGLMIRSTADPKSPFVALVATPGQRVRLKYRGSNTGRAERYWRKLAELRPTEKAFQKSLASWLLRTDRKDEASGIYDRLTSANPEALMEVLQELTPLYESGGRLPELAEKVAAWQPPANSRNDWSYAVFQLLDKLEKQKRYDLVEKITTHWLEWGQEQADTFTKYRVRALQNLNRPEEAKQAILTYFEPTKRAEANSGPTLGFNANGSSSDSRPNWLRSIGMSTSGISIGAIDVIDLAQQQRVIPEVRAIVAKTPKIAQYPGSLKAMEALLAVKMRDVAGIASAKELLKEGGMDNNASGILMALANELRSWPGQAQAAMEINMALEPSTEGDSFLAYGRPSFLLHLATAQQQLGHPGFTETLRTLTTHIGELSAQRGNRNSREFQMSEGQDALAMLLRAGMEKEYIAFLALLKATPDAAKLGWTYDEERKIFEGDAPKPQLMLWLDDAGAEAGLAEIRYEVRREHPYDHGDRFQYLASRGRSIKALEKERTVRFLYGKTPDKLEPIGEVAITKANGTWRAELPEGGGWLRGVIVEKDANGQPTEFLSPMVPVTRSPNLITNAGFTGLAERPSIGGFQIAGWKNLKPGYWDVKASGAPVSGGAIQCELRYGERESVLTGARIPLQPRKKYLQSAWVRPLVGEGADAQIGRRYLDAEGKELKVTYFPSYGSFNWRWHGQRLLPEGTAGAEKEADVIPAAAAFVEPVIKVTRGAEWAGVYLGLAE